MNSNQKGFTLIELMVVVAIIAILASVATSTYSGYVLKANRSETQTLMSAVAQDAEKHFTANFTYTTNLSSMGYVTTPPNSASGVIYPDSKAYSISLATCTSGTVADCVSVVATAQTKQQKDTDCKVMKLETSGKKSSTNATNADSTAICWKL